MIKFIISEKFIEFNLKHVDSGYRIAEKVLNSPLFLSEILNLDHLTYTKDTPLDVSEKLTTLLNGPTIEINVEPYFYKNQNVIGMTEGNGTIFVNTNGAKFRYTNHYLRNACHEFAHFPLGYRHGSNFPNGWRAKMMGDFADKNYSVPYLFEEIAIKVFNKL